MHFFNIVLTVLFVLILILNYFSLNSKKSAIKTVNEMGMGYNLGKAFYNFTLLENEDTDFEIKMWGTKLPTKKMILKIKKFGFKTIRFQVVSMNSEDEFGQVSSEWISGIKEVNKLDN